MRVLKLPIFLLFLGCASNNVDPNSSAFKNGRALYEIGKGQYEDGKYPEAIYSLRQSLKLNPSQPDTEMFLALSLMEMDEFKESDAIYRRLCPTLQERGPCLNNYAALKLRTGDAKGAYELATEALAQNTYTTPELALGNQAKALIQLGKQAEAMALLERAQRIQPRNCDIRNLKTQVLLRAKRFEEGLQTAKLATLQCPISPRSQVWEAYALYKIGRHPQARDKLQYIMNEFRGSEISEYAVKALEKIPDQIPLEEPPL